MKQSKQSPVIIHFANKAGLGSWLQASAALIWLPQAAALAWAVQQLARGEGFRSAVWPAAIIFLLGALRAALQAVGMRITFRVARQYLSALRGEAVSAIARRSPLDKNRPSAGQAASIIAEQAEMILPYLVRYQPVRLRAVLVPFIILTAVFPLSWLAGSILLIAAPLIPLFMALIGLRAKAASEAQMLEISSMNSFLLDRLRGMTTIRMLGAIDRTAQQLRASAEALKKRTMAVLRIAFLSSAVLELFSALGVALVAVYVGFHFLEQFAFGAWGSKLTLGQGLFILLVSPAFFEPLRDLAVVWHDRAAGEAALKALKNLAAQSTEKSALELPAALDNSAQPAVLSPLPPRIEIRHLSFNYPGNEHSIIRELSLEIASGEKIALLGTSGSGKSTLLSLIAGLACAPQGEIYIDGNQLNAKSAAMLRQRMAWIGQNSHFFAGSIAYNVSLNRTEITRGDITQALAVSSLSDQSLNRMIGEGGTGLSGGEALRLALARGAVARHADLILADEPTAHLDTVTAAEVTDGLLKIAKNKTLIVATHDPALAMQMDRVIRLNAVPEEIS